MPETIEERNVKMNRVLKPDLSKTRNDIIGTVGIPTPENSYTFSVVHRRVSTKGEKIIYISLATLGGIVTGLVTYFQFFR